MSFQAMAWAVDRPCRSAGQKLVLLMLADHANGHTGQCNPSHRRLAEECCMGVSTLKGHLLTLAEDSFIEVIRRQNEGVDLPNQYRLMIPSPGQKLAARGQNLAGVGSESGRGEGSESGYKPGIKNQEDNQRRAPKAPAATPDGFAEFWAAWPNTARKSNKKGCLNVWTRRKLEGNADEIISHIEGMKQSKPWKEGFEPAPLTYLNQERWADGVQVEAEQDDLRALFARAE